MVVFLGVVFWLVDIVVVNFEVVVDLVILVMFCCDDVIGIFVVDGGCNDVVFVDWSVLVVGFIVVGFWVVGFGVEGFFCILLKLIGVFFCFIFIFIWLSLILKWFINVMLVVVLLILGVEVFIIDIMFFFEVFFFIKNNVKLMCLFLYEKKLNCNNRYFIFCV